MASRLVVLTSLAVCLLAAGPALAQTCSQLPAMFIVQDRSGSMQESPDPSGCPNCASKWSTASEAVTKLTIEFSNQFRFGLGMFPGVASTDTCSAGGTFANVGSTPEQIASIYANTYPMGGTPTAATLDNTRQYLQSQGLTTQGYVLLITDGLPNCNVNLDPNNCTITSSVCAGYATCCLDEPPTLKAASDLFNAGFKVYVVGFGAGTVGNNKAVLDAIAQAGGTGSAYGASDAQSLSAALTAIAGSVSTCCVNACTVGATQCTADGQSQTCVNAPNGCTQWQVQPCGTGAFCTEGSCQACTNACAPGALQCSGMAAQYCVSGPNGCTMWKTYQDCQYGQACQSGACRSCSSTCTEGAKRCEGEIPEQCVADATGCTQWQPTGAACGDFCSAGSCGSCGTQCTPGETRCDGAGVETCSTDSHGCSTWVAMLGGQCPANQVCADGACRDQCSGGEIPTCASPDQVCQVRVEGAVCMPKGGAADGGTSGGAPGSELNPPPSTTGTGASAGGMNGQSAVTLRGSCGCGESGAAPMVPMLLLAAAALLRRARRGV